MPAAVHSVKRLEGIIQKPKKAISLEDMDKAVARGAKGGWYRHQRRRSLSCAGR